MAEFGPSDGYAAPAFEEPPRGRTRVQVGNREVASRDDPLVQQLADRVSDLLARVEALEERVVTLDEALQALEAGEQDVAGGDDDQVPL